MLTPRQAQRQGRVNFGVSDMDTTQGEGEGSVAAEAEVQELGGVQVGSQGKGPLCSLPGKGRPGGS